MQGERKRDRDPPSSGLEAEGVRVTELEEDQRESGVMEEIRGKTRGQPQRLRFPNIWGKVLRHRGVRIQEAVLLHGWVPLCLRGSRLACTRSEAAARVGTAGQKEIPLARDPLHASYFLS